MTAKLCPHTKSPLPVGEHHKNYFPVGSRALQVELRQPILELAAEHSRQFHHHFGCTISEYLRRVRIARAQSLLACDGLEVAEIALACGFSDQSHFRKAFRRLTGVPPHRYRMRILGKPCVGDSRACAK